MITHSYASTLPRRFVPMSGWSSWAKRPTAQRRFRQSSSSVRTPSCSMPRCRCSTGPVCSGGCASADVICRELVAINSDGELSPGRLNLERAQLLARNRVELSGRECEILKLSAEGLTRAEIGERLRFGPSTVRDVRRDICTKLGAPSMQVAIVVAMRNGLLEVGQ